MDRRTTRFLGAALVVSAAAVGITSVANAGQVRVPGSLLGSDRTMVVDCSATFDGDAVVVVPEDRFDAATLVTVSTSDPAGLATGGGPAVVGSAALVRVHVPAATAPGTYPVELRAAGFRHGVPAEVIDRLTVRVRC